MDFDVESSPSVPLPTSVSVSQRRPTMASPPTRLTSCLRLFSRRDVSHSPQVFTKKKMSELSCE